MFEKKAIQYAPFKDGAGHPFPVEDIMLPYKDTYNGNILIKKAFVKSELSMNHIIEAARCEKDPIYFIENYCRIVSLDDGIIPFKLFDYQKKMIKMYAENRFSLTLTARQMGKTAAMAAFILWFAIFHPTKTIAVLANKGEQAQEIMDRIRMAFEYLPFFLQHGVKVYNKRRIEFDNGSIIFSAATSASGIRGRSVDLCYIDEAAFIENDLTFYESTYPVITSGKESRVIMTTTPRGARGMFYMLWRDSLANRNYYTRLEVIWDAHPKRDERWKEETIANIGYSRFAQEFSCKFQGSSGTLIPTEVLERMQWINPTKEDDSFKVYLEYQHKHIEIPDPEDETGQTKLKVTAPIDPKTDKPRKYLAISDPAGGLGQDYSVCTVLDVTEYPYKIAAKYRNNNISPLLFPHTILNICMTYGNCPVLVEANNDVGGQVTYILYYELEYENVILTSNSERAIGGLREGGKGNAALPGVKTTKKVKSIGCSNLKTLLENEYLVIEDQETIEELGTFIAKGASYEADDECHDDTVMPLVLFSWFIKTELFNEYCGSNIGTDLYRRNVNIAMESILPFGFIEVANNEVVEYAANIGGHAMNVTENNMMSFEQWMAL
jgi:hypothetical protein